jgi:large subunit ribosomal protein L10
MPKTREQKSQVIEGLTEVLKNNAYGVVTDFERLAMPDLDAFRAKAREKGVRYTVIKPTLVQIAAKNAGLDSLSLSKTAKSYALAWGGNDQVTVAKLAHEFAKGSDDRVHITLGIMDGQIMPAADVIVLASLPSYEELLGQVVRGMNAPVSNFVYALNYTQQSFYNVIKAKLEAMA